MTPTRRSSDVTKTTLTVRDVLLLIAGCVGMFGAQLGATYGLRSDIRDLKTSFESYQQKQNDTNSSMQRQIDTNRQESQLNRVNVENVREQIAELKGLLVGAGVKGVK